MSESMSSSQSLPRHVEWLALHHGPLLAACLAAQGVELDVRDALGVLCRADPDPGQHGVQWLCDTLIGGGYLWEDVALGRGSKAGETLDAFAQHRLKLARPARNLASYASLGDVWAAVAGWTEREPEEPATEGGRALRRAQRQQAYQDSMIVWQGADIMLVSPRTVQASQWWGRGTRWCTAARQGNMFAHYNRQAGLLIVVMPRMPDVKLQLHISRSGRIEFMDAQDNRVSQEFVARHWATLSPLVAWMFEQSVLAIRYVPHHLQTPQMCRRALAGSTQCIKWVDPDLLDIDMANRLVDRDASLLASMPARLKTPALCWRAVGCNAAALDDVPDAMRTAEMCAYAMRRPAMLEYVPQHLQTAAMCNKAVKADGGLLKWVRADMHTLELSMRAVSQQGAALQWVPSRYRTRELCTVAMRNCAQGAFPHVPQSVMDEAMCLDAADKVGYCMQWMPARLKTYECATRAVQHDGRNLKWVPDHLHDRALSSLAIKRHGMALAHVRADLVDYDMCMGAVQQDVDAFRYCPPHLVDHHLRLAVVAKVGHKMARIAHEDQTPEIRFAAVESLPEMLGMIAHEDQTAEMCLVAVKKRGVCLRHVAPHLQTPQLCALALAQNPMHSIHGFKPVLSMVAPQLRTLELCTLALLHDPEALEHVPLALREQARPVQGWQAFSRACGSCRRARGLRARTVVAGDAFIALLQSVQSSIDGPHGPRRIVGSLIRQIRPGGGKTRGMQSEFTGLQDLLEPGAARAYWSGTGPRQS